MTVETRRCHVLTDEYGLRAYDARLWPVGSPKAGFMAMAWKLEGDSDVRRDLSIATASAMERGLRAKTAALIEIEWPLVPPKELWETEVATLVRCIGPSDDPVFQTLESSFRNPKPFYQTALGHFVRDEGVGWIEGEGQWLGAPVTLTMDAELEIDIPAEEALIAALLANQSDWDAKARLAISDGLYEIWRDHWRDDEPVIDETEFAARMQIYTIGAHRDGRFELWFRDAGLFAGHDVSVRGTLEGGLEPAEM